MAEPRTQYTFVVRAAQAPAISLALENLKQGNYPIAELVGPLVDDLGGEYYTLSGAFTQAQLASLKGAISGTRILRNTSWWENEGSDTGKLRRERGLRPKEEM